MHIELGRAEPWPWSASLECLRLRRTITLSAQPISWFIFLFLIGSIWHCYPIYTSMINYRTFRETVRFLISSQWAVGDPQVITAYTWSISWPQTKLRHMFPCTEAKSQYRESKSNVIIVVQFILNFTWNWSHCHLISQSVLCFLLKKTVL